MMKTNEFLVSLTRRKNNFCPKYEWGEFHAPTNFILEQTSMNPTYDIVLVLNEDFD